MLKKPIVGFAFVFVLMSAAQDAAAVPVLVAHVDRYGAGASAAVNTTGANFCVAAVTGQSFAPNVSDSKGSTWVTVNTLTGSASATRILYAYVTGGTGHTFTIGGQSFPSGSFACFSGVVGSGGPEANAGVLNSSGTNISTGTITPLSSGALIIAGYGSDGNLGTPLTINNSFIITDAHETTSGLAYGSGIAYLIAGSPTSTTATWSAPCSTCVSARDRGFILSFAPVASAGRGSMTTLGVGHFLPSFDAANDDWEPKLLRRVFP